MRPSILYPVLFCVILGLLVWKPWRSESEDAAERVGSEQAEQTPGRESGDAAESGQSARGKAGPVAAKDLPAYKYGSASRGGTGKFYLGREIAKVMGHEGISWLERDEREDEEAPSRVIQALNFAPDAVVADIGAGSGYYTFRLAPLVPDGEVVAVDIQLEMIAHLEDKAKELGVENVRPHHGTIEHIGLGSNTLDAAIMVDAYHEFSHPAEMMRSIYRALRPGGSVVLLEYRAEDPTVPIKPLHKMTEAQARKEMEAVGFEFEVNHDFLPWQHFMVFRKPE